MNKHNLKENETHFIVGSLFWLRQHHSQYGIFLGREDYQHTTGNVYHLVYFCSDMRIERVGYKFLDENGTLLCEI